MDTKRYNVYLYIAIVILSVIGVIWGISEYFGEYNKQQEELSGSLGQNKNLVVNN